MNLCIHLCPRPRPQQNLLPSINKTLTNQRMSLYKWTPANDHLSHTLKNLELSALIILLVFLLTLGCNQVFKTFMHMKNFQYYTFKKFETLSDPYQEPFPVNSPSPKISFTTLTQKDLYLMAKPNHEDLVRRHWG